MFRKICVIHIGRLWAALQLVLITAGLVTAGLVTAGLVTTGLVTAGLVTAGLITAGHTFGKDWVVCDTFGEN